MERVLAHERITISSSRYSELWNIDEAGVQPICEHPSEALRVQRQPFASTEPKPRDGVQDFLSGANVELEFFAKHTKGTQPWDEALAAYKKLENRLTSVSVRQVVDGLNEFFKDYRNRSISTEHAIDVVLKSIKGEDVEELILFYRRVGP